jgi:hypothetical protein
MVSEMSQIPTDVMERGLRILARDNG